MQELLLNQLNFLDFTANEITDDDIRWLNPLLSQGALIETLYLSKNKLTAIGFKKLCPQILTHPKLRALHMDNMPLDEAAIKQITSILPALKHINLENCAITSQGGKLLAAAFKENQTLETLNLSNNRRMDKVTLKIIIQSLQQHPMLATLKLKQMSLDKDCQNALLILSMSCPKLINIELNGDVINARTAKQIRKNLKNHYVCNYDNSRKLKTTEADCAQSPDQKQLVVEDKLDSLSELVLPGKKLTDRQMRLFSAIVKNNIRMTTLKITNNPNVTVIGLKWLLPNICHHPALINLDLSDNSLQDKGAIVLAKMLPHCQWHKLSIRANKIQAEGGLALANGLYQNQSLTELDLSSNPLTDAVIMGRIESDEKNEKVVCSRLIDALIKQAQLVILSLQNTKISENAGKSLLTMLSNGVEHLYSLNITDNKIPKKLIGHINIRLIDNKKRGLNRTLEICTKKQKELQDEISNLQAQDAVLNVEIRLYELRLEYTKRMCGFFEGYDKRLQEHHRNFELNRQNYAHKITEEEINDRVSLFKGLKFFSEQAAFECINSDESELKKKEDKQAGYLIRREELAEESTVNDAEINSITQQKLALEEQRRDLSDSYGEPDSLRLDCR